MLLLLEQTLPLLGQDTLSFSFEVLSENSVLFILKRIIVHSNHLFKSTGLIFSIEVVAPHLQSLDFILQ